MTIPKRANVKDRGIDSPALGFSIDDEVKRLKAEPEWVSGRENGITLAKYPHMRAVLVVLKRGTSLREHTVEGPMSLYLISGKLDLLAGKVRHTVNRKGLFTLRTTVPFDIRSVTDATFILTIVKI